MDQGERIAFIPEKPPCLLRALLDCIKVNQRVFHLLAALKFRLNLASTIQSKGVNGQAT